MHPCVVSGFPRTPPPPAADGELTLTLQKAVEGETWGSAFQGHGELDASAAEADRKALLLERFQAENPGFDFRGAEVNGTVPDAATFMGGIRKE